ncbi:AAA family ATPase [Candidatus Woesearchaeota archaeon]|nr:AAA family ATPase [Candidatus Woesearchaeota archaeon]
MFGFGKKKDKKKSKDKKSNHKSSSKESEKKDSDKKSKRSLKDILRIKKSKSQDNKEDKEKMEDKEEISSEKESEAIEENKTKKVKEIEELIESQKNPNEDFIEINSKGKIKGKKEKHSEAHKKGAKLNMSQIKMEIEKELKSSSVVKEDDKPVKGKYIRTGIEGFDKLMHHGIPKSSSMLVAGGAGSGKTILCLQLLNHHALKGKKCLYMSFEESEEKLISHMNEFGWNPQKAIKHKNLIIKRFNPFDITRNVDALLMKAKGELLIDVDPILLPDDFLPEIIVVDSLSAIASAFTNKNDSYRIYIEQLFRFFEKIDANTFLITETKQVPTIYSPTGVEEFLADGVTVLYNFKKGNIREKGIEVLKLRGAKHNTKIVAMTIEDKGIKVFPDQEVFAEF